MLNTKIFINQYTCDIQITEYRTRITLCVKGSLTIEVLWISLQNKSNKR